MRLSGRGLVVLTGCGHAGIVNVVRHAQRLTGETAVAAVIGGFHLSGPMFEPIIEPTVAAFDDLQPEPADARALHRLEGSASPRCALPRCVRTERRRDDDLALSGSSRTGRAIRPLRSTESSATRRVLVYRRRRMSIASVRSASAGDGSVSSKTRGAACRPTLGPPGLPAGPEAPSTAGTAAPCRTRSMETPRTPNRRCALVRRRDSRRVLPCRPLLRQALPHRSPAGSRRAALEISSSRTRVEDVAAREREKRNVQSAVVNDTRGVPRDFPAGTVTFLFTDIEGSTRLLHEHGERYADR